MLGIAFLEGRQVDLDRLAVDAAQRKDQFAIDERARRTEAQARMDRAGKTWSAVFAGWDANPSAVIDDWTHAEMQRNPRYYGLPSDPHEWPKPREFVTLWYARAYHVARLRDVLREGRRFDDGGDLTTGCTSTTRPTPTCWSRATRRYSGVPRAYAWPGHGC